MVEKRFITREECFQMLHDNVDCYFSINGRLISDPFDIQQENIPIQVHLRLRGGKGGFGSMLRAIGNQIEKTNNHDMCRDLSGRRMRDVNAEAKLKEWYSKADERERTKMNRYLEKQRRRREALDKGLLHDHKFNDPEFVRRKDHISSELQDAVDVMLTQIVDEAGPSEPVKKRPKFCFEQLDESGSSYSSDCSDDHSVSGDAINKEDELSLSPKSQTPLDIEPVCNVTDVVQEIAPQNGDVEQDAKNVCDISGQISIEKPESCICLTEAALEMASSAVDLEQYGLDALKQALSIRGLKFGGTLSERAARLFSVRGLDPSKYPAKVLVRPCKKDRST